MFAKITLILTMFFFIAVHGPGGCKTTGGHSDDWLTTAIPAAMSHYLAE